MTSLPDLWPHQVKEQENNHREKLMLLWSPRLGKSRAAIEFIMHVSALCGPATRILITAPLVVCPQWVAMLTDALGPNTAIAAYGMPTARVAAALKLETCPIFVMNDDKLPALEESLLKWKPEVYIGDESHRFRTPSSARGRAM